jgi:hypothetical protein
VGRPDQDGFVGARTTGALALAAADNALGRLWTILPATARRFRDGPPPARPSLVDASPGPKLRRVLRRGEPARFGGAVQRLPGDRRVELYESPPWVDIPVAWLGGGAAWLRGPLADGAPGAILCCSRGIHAWARSAGAAPVDPGTGRVHEPGDAYFVPGFAPAGLAPLVLAEGWCLADGAGTTGLLLPGADVRLAAAAGHVDLLPGPGMQVRCGGEGAQAVALADLVAGVLAALKGLLANIPAGPDPISEAALVKVRAIAGSWTISNMAAGNLGAKP